MLCDCWLNTFKETGQKRDIKKCIGLEKDYFNSVGKLKYMSHFCRCSHRENRSLTSVKDG